MRREIGIFTLALVIVVSGCKQSQRDVLTTAPVPQNPTSTTTSSSPLAELGTAKPEDISADWVTSQLEGANVSLVSIVDRKLWEQVPVSNAILVLGIARKPDQRPLRQQGLEYLYFPFVLLAQPQTGKDFPSPKLLGLAVSPDFYLTPPISGHEENRPLSIDPGPYQIRVDEFAVGARFLTGSLGNKGGPLSEVLSLYRYHDGELKEIFRDVVWIYSRYSDDWKSCNVEMRIITGPSETSGFFAVTREYSRSYLGEAWARSRLSDTDPGDLTEVSTCSLTTVLKSPNTHVWNAAKALYLDARGRLLDPDNFFNGWPYR